MSDALHELVTRFFRVRAADAKYSHDDPGLPLTPTQVDGAIARLSDVERATLDEAAVRMLVPEFEREQEPRQRHQHATEPGKTPLFATLKSLDPAARARVVTTWSIVLGMMTNDRDHCHYNRAVGQLTFWLRDALAALKKRPLAFTLPQARAIIQANAKPDDDIMGRPFGFETLDVALNAIEANRAAWTFDDEDRRVFGDVVVSMADFACQADSRRHIAMLKEIVAGGVGPDVLWPGEPWAAAINASLGAIEERTLRDGWARLLTFAGTASLTKPSKAWLKDGDAAIAAIASEPVGPRIAGWLRTFAAEPRPAPPPAPARWTREGSSAARAAEGGALANTAAVVGLIWLGHTAAGEALATTFADVAESVARWPQAARERSAHVALAAVRALGAADDEASLAQLARLEMRVRWPKLKKEVKRQFDAAAARRGGDRSELAESLVPDFGLVGGVATIDLGDGASARLTLGRADKPSVEWHSTDGKVSRVMPRALKPHAATVKQTVDDIERMRAAQRTRLDLLLRRRRAWPIDVWRQRYLDHGLVGTLARRLIWLVGDFAAMWRDGALVDAAGATLDVPTDAVVRLWHPALRSTDEVLTWRDALVRWEVTQPFKQAHREIYLLTDAERRTNTYSNRFAGHIVRGPTLLAVAQARHWKMGQYGGASSPSVELPDDGLRAEWWMEPAGDDHTPYGAPLYLATDQVRFVDLATNEAVPIDRVPPLALSETLRDVDLFVGVASVGSDPNWQDAGADGRFRAYWQAYSFGDLTASAKTRADALAALLPRLTTLRDRARLDDKFLVVRGSLRSYKIHLGSGNILMEPNDQYLCIVPDRRASADGVFLPFEGDAMLSVILSKAFLLADDATISDPTIVSQIGR